MARIRKSDVQSVEQKLNSFARDLPEQEQNVLGWLMVRAQAAASSPGELSDEALESVAGGQDLASSLGFSDSPGDETFTIGWSKSFDQQ